MLDPLNVIYLILGSIFSLGVLAGGIGYLVSLFQDGKNKVGSDQLKDGKTLVEYLTTQNEGYAKALTELRQEIANQNSKIAVLTATISERDKQLAEYKAIFTGTDPATKKFQESLLSNIKTQDEFRLSTTQMLTELLRGQTKAKDHASQPINITGQITQ